MKSIYSGLVGAALSIALCAVPDIAAAQKVGTIGVGDIHYEVKNPKTDRQPENVINAINSGLNTALIKTRKFTVLDYAQLTQRLDKQSLRLEDYYTKKYSGTEYSQAGLDYILTATITEFGAYRQKRGKSENAVGLVDLDFKLIGVADQTQDIESSVSAQTNARVAIGDDQVVEQVLDQAIEKSVDQLVDKVITGLFPIRVMKISDEGEITLNYGSGLFKQGDTVLVFEKGEDVVLDESGQAIGNSIATLQIISAEKKFANAQALDGFDSLELGQKGHLVLSGG